jgi:3'(2'), 5'-bisphosphate nucleotidase
MTRSPDPLDHEAAVALDLARRAGAVVLRYRHPDLEVSHKAHDEPVTRADREANDLIVAGLRAAFPDDAVLSEESAAVGEYQTATRAWMVDPLDGTRDYVRGLPGFAVMIGLCLDGRPSLGVVYQPLGDVLYRAVTGHGAVVEEAGSTRPLRVSDRRDPRGCRLVSSASHRMATIDQVRAALGIDDEISLGSVGLKLGLIARAERDLYVNPEGFSKLWDSCAPEVILAESGGKLTDIHGRRLDYRRAEVRHLDGLLASNGLLHDAVVTAITPLFHEGAPPPRLDGQSPSGSPHPRGA